MVLCDQVRGLNLGRRVQLLIICMNRIVPSAVNLIRSFLIIQSCGVDGAPLRAANSSFSSIILVETRLLGNVQWAPWLREVNTSVVNLRLSGTPRLYLPHARQRQVRVATFERGRRAWLIR